MEITKKEIIKLLSEKSLIKYKAYDNTFAVFNKIKALMTSISTDIKDSVLGMEINIPVTYKETGIFEMEMRVASDLILMNMHSNIFKMPNSHYVSQLKYVKQDHMRAYCGVINIYNFIADSFKYNRVNDYGYLIGRIFINHENHFFVEGKKQLGFLFNDFASQQVDDETIGKIINTAIIYSIQLDLIAPPLDSIKTISVGEMNQITSSISLKTGKKLGFRFSHENKNPH